MSEPLGGRPADAQSGEAPGPVADHNTRQIFRANAQAAHGEVDEANDFGRMTPGSLHMRSALRGGGLTGGNARDLGGGVEGEPNPAHQPHPSPGGGRKAEG